MSNPFGEPWETSNLARVIACVNACAGIADPAAALQGAREALEGLKDAIMSVQDWNDTYVGEQLDKATAALAALGGGK